MASHHLLLPPSCPTSSSQLHPDPPATSPATFSLSSSHQTLATPLFINSEHTLPHRLPPPRAPANHHLPPSPVSSKLRQQQLLLPCCQRPLPGTLIPLFPFQIWIVSPSSSLLSPSRAPPSHHSRSIPDPSPSSFFFMLPGASLSSQICSSPYFHVLHPLDLRPAPDWINLSSMPSSLQVRSDFWPPFFSPRLRPSPPLSPSLLPPSFSCHDHHHNP